MSAGYSRFDARRLATNSSRSNASSYWRASQMGASAAETGFHPEREREGKKNDKKETAVQYVNLGTPSMNTAALSDLPAGSAFVRARFGARGIVADAASAAMRSSLSSSSSPPPRPLPDDDRDKVVATAAADVSSTSSRRALDAVDDADDADVALCAVSPPITAEATRSLKRCTFIICSSSVSAISSLYTCTCAIHHVRSKKPSMGCVVNTHNQEKSR